MKVSIVCQSQFGYHLDTWYYCKYLTMRGYDIEYICWDYGKPKKELSGVLVNYLGRDSLKVFRNVTFIYLVIRLLKVRIPDAIFVKYFIGCHLLNVFITKQVVVDVRTASVSSNKFVRWVSDSLLKLELLFFKRITVISESLATSLSIGRKSEVLPLAGEPLIVDRNASDILELCYIGTLTGRNILDTLIAIKSVKEKLGSVFLYHIVGDGWGSELKSLKDYALDNGLSDVVIFHGFLHHDDVPKVLSSVSVGISYVPKTSYFDRQPPTKTFEYLLSDMFVIATNTFENTKILKDNGLRSILIDDNPLALERSITDIISNQKKFIFHGNKDIYARHSWSNVVSQLEIILGSSNEYS